MGDFSSRQKIIERTWPAAFRKKHFLVELALEVCYVIK